MKCASAPNRVLALILSIMLVVSCFNVIPAEAAETDTISLPTSHEGRDPADIADQGDCGAKNNTESVHWELYNDGILFIYGEGSIGNYVWESWADKIKGLVVSQAATDSRPLR